MISALEWLGAADGRPLLRLIDQRKLPGEIAYVECRTAEEVAEAIRSMAVRGAPAIGAAAAYGIVLGAIALARRGSDAGESADVFREGLEALYAMMRATRPTAVNLFWAIDRMAERAEALLPQGAAAVVRGLEEEARAIQAEDVEINRAIGAHGAALIPDGAGILTHCNTGSLATCGYGTALGVIRAAWEAGKAIRVFADETRPFLQGSRLTAWELLQENIPVTLITDNAAGYLMQRGLIQAAIVGADRVAANGDVINKIGTYTVAVLARAHGIPFYAAVPLSTIDLTAASGADVTIEERDPAEVTHLAGVRVAPQGVDVMNPAFDVTPHTLVSAIITEKGVVRPPYPENLRALFASIPASR